MRGSAIAVRIADFLKQYPPFEFLEVEALRELARHGKVKFHEQGEIVFSAGQPRDKWIYVIQQGKVRVVEESGSKEELIDLRGPGDILGLQGIRSDEPYTHTCKTDSDTILYGLPREPFSDLAGASQEARRYLAAYFSLSPVFIWRGGDDQLEADEPGGPVTLRKGGLQEVGPPQELAHNRLFTVAPDTPVREVARQLQSKRVEVVLVVDANGCPLGKVSDADLRDRLVEGVIDPTRPVGEIMFTDLVAAGPDENTGDLLVKLTEHAKAFLVVTEDGSLASKAVGMASERNLFLQYGRFPSVIGEAISSAPDVTSLRILRDRIEALIMEFIDDRAALPWLMRMVGVLNRKMMQRIIGLVIEEMEASGIGKPPTRYSWLMMGSGGRDELLIRSAVYHALVFEDPPRGGIDAAQRYFRQMAWRVAAGIRQCGFLESPQNVLAQNPAWCLSVSAMRQQFRRMIEDPVRWHVYSARDAFDFREIVEGGYCPLAQELRDEISEALQEHPGFIRHMAKDSLMNQPPRTIFQGYVVDGQGAHRDELAIKSHALLPLVDVGRVLALASSHLDETATWRRLDQAAQRFGTDHPFGGRLHEAAEAFLVAQYARISQGLRHGTDGATIVPSALDARTRALLITAFRTIYDILEQTANHFDIKWRT
jgi:CBS domain-containing protein